MYQQLNECKQFLKNNPDINLEANDSRPWFEIHKSKHGKISKTFVPFLLAEHLLTVHSFIFCKGDFYLYKGGVFEKISNPQMMKIIYGYLDEKRTSKQATEVLKQMESYCEKKLEELNIRENICNLRNCIIEFDTKTGEKCLKEHSPEYLSTIQYNVEYNGNATCHKWHKFLDDVLPIQQQKLLQEIMGYYLIPNTRAKKFFVFNGITNCGKSVILNVLLDILGYQNCTNITLQDFCNPDKRFITSNLFGKVANICGDLPATMISDTGTLKAMTGEDLVFAEKKGVDGFSFRCKAKLLFSANQLPKNYNDRTAAFYNRLLILPFKIQIPGGRQDKELNLKLSEEKSGILNWMIEGLQRLLSNNLRFSITDENISEIEKYKRENNPTLEFIGEEVVFDKDEFIHRQTLYQAYKDFCAENGLSSKGRQKFIEEVEAYARSKGKYILYDCNCVVQNKRGRGYQGLNLRELYFANELSDKKVCKLFEA